MMIGCKLFFFLSAFLYFLFRLMRLNSTVMWTFGNFGLIAGFIFLSLVWVLKDVNGNGQIRTGGRCATRCAMYNQSIVSHTHTHTRRRSGFVPVMCVCIVVNTTDSSAPHEWEKRWLDIWALLHRSRAAAWLRPTDGRGRNERVNMKRQRSFWGFVSSARQVRLFTECHDVKSSKNACRRKPSKIKKKVNVNKHKTKFCLFFF